MKSRSGALAAAATKTLPNVARRMPRGLPGRAATPSSHVAGERRRHAVQTADELVRRGREGGRPWRDGTGRGSRSEIKMSLILIVAPTCKDVARCRARTLLERWSSLTTSAARRRVQQYVERLVGAPRRPVWRSWRPSGLAGASTTRRSPTPSSGGPSPSCGRPGPGAAGVALAADHRADVVLFGHGFPSWIAPGLPRGASRRSPSRTARRCGSHDAGPRRRAAPGTPCLPRGHRRQRAHRRAPARRGRHRPHRPLSRRGPDRFAPTVDGGALRERFGLGDRPLVARRVSRLVPRKGQDAIEAMRSVRVRIPTPRSCWSATALNATRSSARRERNRRGRRAGR
jgi:hypothetical protein